jgi:four helix bundle protein
MRINSFEDVLSWQEGKSLYIEFVEKFKDSKDYAFKDQLMRAALSITNNIAEGFDRNTDKELRMFLYISRGSCAEVRSMLHIAKEIGYISPEEHTGFTAKTVKISKLLTGFINKLATKDQRLATKQPPRAS